MKSEPAFKPAIFSPACLPVGKKAALSLALSLLFALPPAAMAGGVNQTYDGENVPGGIHHNTPDGETTFTNSNGKGLYVRAGDTVIGREVDPHTLLENGNGGNLHFRAPGQVVRIDGNIDVSGILKNGVPGNGGRVTIDSAFLYQNGQIFANGANGGMVQMNVGSMTMGPNARIEAMGLQGAGGRVDITARNAFTMDRGAVIDTSGAVIGTYNPNVIQIQGDMVNLDGVLQANGLLPGQSGGKIAITSCHDIHIGPNGQLLANGANGRDGDAPTAGGNGGRIEVDARRNLEHEGLMAANGGHGGTNPEIASGPVTGDGTCQKTQLSQGQDGAPGGNGGSIMIAYKGEMTGQGGIEVRGGNGGDGQQAVSNALIDGPHEHIAIGGNGANGGNGGDVEFRALPPQAIVDRIKLDGGSGGQGGAAATLNSCGRVQPGAKGACGQPGHVTILPPCKTPPPSTPPLPPGKTPPPSTPLFPLYPKVYPRLGDALPARPTVLSYNRSIFLARSPIPIVRRKPVIVTPSAPPPPPPVKPTPTVKMPPPQRKVQVRGYW